MNHSSSVKLLDAATAVGSGAKQTPLRTPKRSFQMIGATTAGAGAVSVVIECSNIENPTLDTDWLTLMTISLVLSTTPIGDGQTTDAPWRHIRARVASISGTGATATVYMGG